MDFSKPDHHYDGFSAPPPITESTLETKVEGVESVSEPLDAAVAREEQDDPEAVDDFPQGSDSSESEESEPEELPVKAPPKPRKKKTKKAVDSRRRVVNGKLQ